MARPWVLVCLLLLIVFTSQLEWKQQLGNEIEASPNVSQKEKQQQHSSNREEVVKEKKKVKGERPSCFFSVGIEDFAPCIYKDLVK
ncbi:hypothetical protein OIU77_017692 [Salix suchowensis]|uniref:Uncharacterized protein n=1 Tax=Salix suchowensis TaxID=1278906 RepID=A0ABQ8ZQ34_9ROSI|nr:hypothetical protein OIU77_017692 [Salix suchowensis]